VDWNNGRAKGNERYDECDVAVDGYCKRPAAGADGCQTQTSMSPFTSLLCRALLTPTLAQPANQSLTQQHHHDSIHFTSL